MSDYRCIVCNKGQSQVQQLVAIAELGSGYICICNQCIAFCVGLVEELRQKELSSLRTQERVERVKRFAAALEA